MEATDTYEPTRRNLGRPTVFSATKRIELGAANVLHKHNSRSDELCSESLARAMALLRADIHEALEQKWGRKSDDVGLLAPIRCMTDQQ